DIDGDSLPNLSEPVGTCLVGDTDPKRNRDCDGDLMGDATEYIFSSLCVTTGTFTCPGSTCLHPINANFDGNPQPDWKVHSDGTTSDYLFNYGEAQLHLKAVPGTNVAVAVLPNPCVSDSADLAANTDGDTCPSLQNYCRNGIERFIGTNDTQKCANDFTIRNEPVDAQPTDINDDRRTNLSDVVGFGAFFNIPNPGDARYEGLVQVGSTFDRGRRFDFNADGGVNLSDVVAVGGLFNTTCTP
ncbi:MAG: hypothetical protein ABIU97_10335, partial [Dehalococcoidia bacterium]